MKSTELEIQLAQFTGSATFTRHTLIRSVLMTEGVAFLADAAGAHWLTDVVVSYQHKIHVQREPFQVWHLTVDTATRCAKIVMNGGNSKTSIVTQALDYTDFPLDEIVLWLVQSGEHWVLMLPSEY